MKYILHILIIFLFSPIIFAQDLLSDSVATTSIQPQAVVDTVNTPEITSSEPSRTQIDLSDIREPFDSLEFLKILNAFNTPVEEQLKDIVFAVKVMDSDTKKPVQAVLELNKISRGQLLRGVGECDIDGSFRLTVTNDSEMELVVKAKDYMPFSTKVNFKNLSAEIDRLNKLFELQKIEVGKPINLKSIRFAQGEYELLPSSYKELDNLVAMMIENPSMKIELGGHTESTGSAKANQRLSEKRVEAVKEYMVKHGVKRKKVKEVGYGSSKPLNTKSDDKSQEQNRRVEFIVLKK